MRKRRNTVVHNMKREKAHSITLKEYRASQKKNNQKFNLILDIMIELKSNFSKEQDVT